MSNKLQIRRGTKAELDLITLSAGELGWTTDTKGLYIGDGAANNLYATEYIDWSATGAEQIHADRLSGVLSGVLLADGTIPLTANWNIGNYNLGINTVPSYPLHINHHPGDATGYTAYLDVDPTGTLTAAQTHTGLYVNMNTAVNRNGSTYHVRAATIGAFSNGAADISTLYGLELSAQHNVATSLSELIGLKLVSQVQSGTVSNLYGNYVSVDLATGSNATAAYLSYVLLSLNSTGNLLSTAYGYYAYLSQVNGTFTTAYAFRGGFNGTIGTKWGVYITGEDKSYFSGKVGIGQTSPAESLSIKGDFSVEYESSTKRVVLAMQPAYASWVFFDGGVGWTYPMGISDTKANLGAVDFYDGWVGIGNLNFATMEACAGTNINEFSTDGTLAGDSDNAVPTEKAVKTYVDNTGFKSKARGYRATAQTIPQTEWTKVQLNYESFDVLGEFDNVTNYRFTASQAGYYLVFGQVSPAYAVPDGTRIITRIYKNGSMEISSDKVVGATAYTAQSVSGIVYLAATDYLELWYYHGDAAGDIVLGSDDTFMTVHRIS